MKCFSPSFHDYSPGREILLSVYMRLSSCLYRRLSSGRIL